MFDTLYTITLCLCTIFSPDSAAFPFISFATSCNANWKADQYNGGKSDHAIFAIITCRRTTTLWSWSNSKENILWNIWAYDYFYDSNNFQQFNYINVNYLRLRICFGHTLFQSFLWRIDRSIIRLQPPIAFLPTFSSLKRT